MASSAPVRTLAAVDIGTTKVAAVVGRCREPDHVEVVGLGQAESTGLANGVIVDIGATTEAVGKAVEAAQRTCGLEAGKVVASISGDHVSAQSSEGSTAIAHGMVGDREIESVMEVARAVPMDAGRMPLHVIPQQYKIDFQGGIRDPHGMAGRRLEVKIHVVTCATNAVENLRRAIEGTGLECSGVVLSPLASSAALLGRDERELGVCLIDIGGGTTDIVVYLEGALQFACVLPLAGDVVTRDIAVVFKTPLQNAEDLKVNYGCALQELAKEKEVVQVPGVGRQPDRQLRRSVLATAVEDRCRELLEDMQRKLDESAIDLSRLASGVVLTGGSANLEGIALLAEEVFQVSVALGLPTRSTGLESIVQSPSYSTGVGLLYHSLSHGVAEPEEKGDFGGRWRNGIKRWFGRGRQQQA